MARISKFKVILIGILFFGAFVIPLNTNVFADVYVNGYYRKDGTYVQGHYRSDPDGNFNNNWSTKGNVNPYTGKVGTKTQPPSNYNGKQYKLNTTTTNPIKYTNNASLQGSATNLKNVDSQGDSPLLILLTFILFGVGGYYGFKK